MGFFALQKVPAILWANDAKDAVALLDADTAAKRQAALEANQSNKFADLMRRSLDVQTATIEDLARARDQWVNTKDLRQRLRDEMADAPAALQRLQSPAAT